MLSTMKSVWPAGEWKRGSIHAASSCGQRCLPRSCGSLRRTVIAFTHDSTVPEQEPANGDEQFVASLAGMKPRPRALHWLTLLPPALARELLALSPAWERP
jgi:hypothetical protein